MTFRWTVKLAEDGHAFTGGEWRCVHCRRHAFALLKDKRPCLSPTPDGDYVFIGGPLDGEWMPFPEGPPSYWKVAIPAPLDLRVLEPPDARPEYTHEEITYSLQRPKGGAGLVYLYDR